MYYQRPIFFRILESFFRHKKIFAISFMTIIFLLIVFVATQHKTYTTTYTCELNRDPISNPLSDSQQGGMDWNAVTSAVEHFNTILQTQDFDQAAISNSPIAFKKPIDLSTLQARAAFQKAVRVWSESADSFYVEVSWANPDDSDALAQAVISQFIEQTAQDKSAFYQQEVEFTQSQVADYKAKLTKAEAQLAQFKKENSAHLPNQQEAIQEQLISLTERLQEMKLQQAELEDKEKLLQDQVAQTPKTITASETSGRSPLEMQLQNLQIQLDQDLTIKQMKPSHPEVLSLQQQIASLSKRLETKRKEGSPEASGLISNTIQPNPQYQSLYSELQENQIDQKGLVAQIGHTQQLIDQTQTGVSAVPEEERVLSNLMRDYQFNSDTYSTLKRKLTEAMLNQQVNLRQARQAYQAYKTNGPTSSTTLSRIILLFLGGVLLAFIVSSSLVIATELMDHTLTDPFETQNQLGVPVLAILPESADLHVEDTKSRRLSAGDGKRVGLRNGAPLLPPPSEKSQAAAMSQHDSGTGYTGSGFKADTQANAGGAA